jgi:hypothetical protein
MYRGQHCAVYNYEYFRYSLVVDTCDSARVEAVPMSAAITSVIIVRPMRASGVQRERGLLRDDGGKVSTSVVSYSFCRAPLAQYRYDMSPSVKTGRQMDR